jgi:hypothetical protein
VKLTKELTKNLATLDAYGDKLAVEEKNLGQFFTEQVPPPSLRKPSDLDLPSANPATRT